MTLEVRELSAHAAAKAIGCHDRRVLRLLATGALGGYRTEGGQWRVPTWSIRAWQEQQIAAQSRERKEGAA